MAMIAIDLRASLAGRDTLPLLHVARDVGIAGTLDACALGQLALDLHVVRHAGTRLAITTNHQCLDIGCGAGLGPAAVVDADVTVATEIRNARFGGDEIGRAACRERVCSYG